EHLPSWARFFIDLGQSVAAQFAGRTDVTVVATVPIRTYAAPLCAVGVVLGRVHLPITRDYIEHFSRLRALPIESTLIYRVTPTKRMTCRLKGVNDNEIILESGGTLVCRVPALHCLRIEPSRTTLIALP